jgi:hypothetical protein
MTINNGIHMSNRIGHIHLKQFIVKLIESELTKVEVLALVDRYIDTVQSDKKELVDGLQQLMQSPVEGKRNAENLIERFGKMPQIIFSIKEAP